MNPATMLAEPLCSIAAYEMHARAKVMRAAPVKSSGLCTEDRVSGT